MECRDTAKTDSDKSFSFFDSRFTDNRLVAIAYHIDEEKMNNLYNGTLPNSENGPQTLSNHYMDSVVEHNNVPLMTDRENLPIDFSDIYTEGYIIDKSKLSSYAGEIRYSVEILSADYSQRTMNFRVSQ